MRGVLDADEERLLGVHGIGKTTATMLLSLGKPRPSRTDDAGCSVPAQSVRSTPSRK
jgi:hypothetical protein